MLCNAYDDMSDFSILNTRGVTYVMQVCPTFIPTQNSTKNPLVVGYEKGQNIKCLGEVSYTLSDRENHLRNLYLFCKTYKISG